MTKLNTSRVKWLTRQVIRHGRKPSEVASVYGVSVRRVQQLIRHFKKNCTMLEIKKERRPKTFLTEEQKAAKLNVLIHAINADHDTTFTAGKYQKFLARQGIKMIHSRVKNPQTNGKLERLWQEYNKHRWNFPSLQEWIDWYNNRLHGALKLEWAETPVEAFQRKLRPECLVGMMFK